MTTLRDIINAAADRFEARPLYRASIEARAELGRLPLHRETLRRLALAPASAPATCTMSDALCMAPASTAPSCPCTDDSRRTCP